MKVKDFVKYYNHAIIDSVDKKIAEAIYCILKNESNNTKIMETITTILNNYVELQFIGACGEPNTNIPKIDLSLIPLNIENALIKRAENIKKAKEDNVNNIASVLTDTQINL